MSFPLGARLISTFRLRADAAGTATPTRLLHGVPLPIQPSNNAYEARVVAFCASAPAKERSDFAGSIGKLMQSGTWALSLCLSGQEVGKMLKWLFRIGLGYFVTKLAEEYLHPSRGKTRKSRSPKTAKRRKEA